MQDTILAKTLTKSQRPATRPSTTPSSSARRHHQQQHHRQADDPLLARARAMCAAADRMAAELADFGRASHNHTEDFDNPADGSQFQRFSQPSPSSLPLQKDRAEEVFKRNRRRDQCLAGHRQRNGVDEDRKESMRTKMRDRAERAAEEKANAMRQISEARRQARETRQARARANRRSSTPGSSAVVVGDSSLPISTSGRSSSSPHVSVDDRGLLNHARRLAQAATQASQAADQAIASMVASSEARRSVEALPMHQPPKRHPAAEFSSEADPILARAKALLHDYDPTSELRKERSPHHSPRRSPRHRSSRGAGGSRGDDDGIDLDGADLLERAKRLCAAASAAC